MTDTEILEESNKEFQWLYKQAGPTGLAKPSEVIGADPALADAIDEDGTVDWRRLRDLVTEKWERAKRGEDTTRPLKPPAEPGVEPIGGTNEEWARATIKRLNIGGP